MPVVDNWDAFVGYCVPPVSKELWIAQILEWKSLFLILDVEKNLCKDKQRKL